MPLLADVSWRLAYPWALLLLLLLPLLALLKGRTGQHPAILFSSLHLLNGLGPLTRSRSGWLKGSLIYLTLALVIVGLSRPQRLDTTETIAESGIELILAIDVSYSMDVTDFFIGEQRVTRLTAAKKVTRDFIKGRPSDRIGLMAFAGRPYQASHITLEHDYLLDNMNRVQIDMIEDQGTAIGSAVAASARRLDKRPAKSKVIVLLTDGANNAGNLTPIMAAKLAKTLGIKIYTIAIGTYGKHEVYTKEGKIILEDDFDEATLQEIAKISDGVYFRAEDMGGLENIFASIDELEKTEIKRHLSIRSEELFQWFAASALGFGLLSMVAGETFLRRYP